MATKPYDKILESQGAPLPGQTSLVTPAKPLVDTKSTEPSVPDIKKVDTPSVAPIEPPVVVQPESGGVPKFTNIPEKLESGQGWKGFLPVGEAGEGKWWPKGGDVRSFLPQGSYNYAAMSRLYPEWFEDPQLAPIQDEIEELETSLKSLGVDPDSVRNEPLITHQTKVEVMAQYDQDAFEEQLLKQMGGNPYQMNPMGELNYRWQREQKAIFNEVFGGQVDWHDRTRLTQEERQYWNQVKKQWRAETYQQLANERTGRIQEYENAMGNFASRRKNHLAALEKRQEEQEKATKKPDFEKMPSSDGSGRITLWQWDPSAKKMIDTGQIAKIQDNDLPPEIKNALAMYRALKPNQQSNEMAQIIIAQNPDMVDNPVIKSMMGEDQDPATKKARKGIEKFMAGYAKEYLGMLERKGADPVGTVDPNAPKPDPKTLEISTPEAKIIETIPGSKGNDVPVWSFVSGAEYSIGDLIKGEGEHYHVMIGENKTQPFRTREEAVKYSESLTHKKL
jgi:hypothetical protein